MRDIFFLVCICPVVHAMVSWDVPKKFYYTLLAYSAL